MERMHPAVPGTVPERIRRAGTGPVERIKPLEELRERQERDKLIVHEARKGRAPQQIARFVGTDKRTVIRVLRMAGITVSRGRRPDDDPAMTSENETPRSQLQAL